MSEECFEVPPLSRLEIRKITDNLRQVLGLRAPYFRIVEFLEHVLPSVDSDFQFDVKPAQIMGSNHGLTSPDEKLIVIREDVYNGACGGRGRDRLTMAHELGHYVLHSNVSFARKSGKSNVPAFSSSEWQASCFGAELLVPYQHLLCCQSPKDAESIFGVSAEAANYQWRIINKRR